MNVLMLSGKFGMGHNSAAYAIKEDLENKYDKNINIKTIDICEYLFPKAHKTIYKGFGIIADKYTGVYNFASTILNNKSDNLNIPLKRVFSSNIKYLVEGFNTDIIISTLPLSSKIISEYKEYYNCNIPLITCITDVTAHAEWINSNTDIYLVATQGVRDQLIKSGVRKSDIYISGIPVKCGFKDDENQQQNKNEKHLLIMGGGLGLLPKEEEFYIGLNNATGFRTTIITGKNKTAYKKLHGKYENIEVVGYTNKVSKYMKEADLLISKPGGVTLFETIHSELPILAFNPNLAQELYNADYIENEAIGKIVRGNVDMVKEITSLLNNDLLLTKYRRNMHSIKRDLVSNAPVIAINRLESSRVAS